MYISLIFNLEKVKRHFVLLLLYSKYKVLYDRKYISILLAMLLEFESKILKNVSRLLVIDKKKYK